MASTRPWWFSEPWLRRVPNSMANKTTIMLKSTLMSWGDVSGANRLADVDTAWICMLSKASMAVPEQMVTSVPAHWLRYR